MHEIYATTRPHVVLYGHPSAVTTTKSPSNHPALRGVGFALFAALLFGASTPLVQRFGENLGPWLTAAMLYLGAALVALLFPARRGEEASLRRGHVPRLVWVALCGAVIGPAALAWGLQRTSALSASLMLSLEGMFTVLLGVVLYRESMDRRVVAAVGLLVAGAILLIIERSDQGNAQMLGLLAVLAASFAWALDNTLSRSLADIDPSSVVFSKGTIGAICSLLVAFGAGEPLGSWPQMIALCAVGALGYGVSLRFYLLAQRAIGAARTGSVFAIAPFMGALVAFALGERNLTLWLLGGSVLMLAGIYLHTTERHAHLHRHELVEHEHAHRHDDEHHNHRHNTMPKGAHSHPHRHEPQVHDHGHVPDLHHGHTHE